MKPSVIACNLLKAFRPADCRPFLDQLRRLSSLRSDSLRSALPTALLLAPLAAIHAADPSVTPSGPPADRKWKLVWSDEFDGKTLDTTRWFVKQPEPWIWPGIKTSPQPANLDIDGQGHCVVQLTRDPDGTVRHPGSIVSKFEKAYGYFETRAQFSRQPGWWSAVWLAGFPYECGVDTFTSPQEFDIFEDFYKPKKQNDIQHCYHCSVKLAQHPGDQGNATGLGEGAILRSAKLSRTSAARKVLMDDYSGWHTVGFRWTPLEHVFYVDGRETLRQTYRDVPVTNVPQRLYISACLRTPKSADAKPFYGRLEEAQLPDKLVVDYVRVYEEDTEPLKAPEVTLTTDKPGPFRVGEPVTFRVKATAPGRKVSSLMLFSMGRLRVEKTVETATSATEATFAVTNLFPGVLNTVIAMAKDDAGLVGQSAILRTEVLTGKEYTGTPWQGTPQKVPGTVRGGCYDEGGNGVAFRSAVVGPSDVRLEHRKTELGDLPEAVGVGGDRATWITYEVDVAASGEYDAELFMNRPDYATPSGTPVQDERIRMNLGASGSAGAPLTEWTLPATWNSGVGWRSPQKSLGKRKVRLPAGRHKLVMFFDGIHAGHTYFCKLVFTPAPAQPVAGSTTAPPEANYDESKVPSYTLPDPLLCFDGQRVNDVKLWREKRRPEILRAFAENVYGRTPVLKTEPRYEVTETDARSIGGLATRTQVTIRLFPEADAPRIDLLLFIPNAASKPVPAFLSLNYGNQGVHDDAAIKPSRDTKTKRGENASRWPLEMILKRGYALATFAGADVEQDRHGSGTSGKPDAWRVGVRGYALRKAGRDDRAEDDWGTIGAWAWGLSRALDYLETVAAIDARKVAVIGHSRTGKTALWAAAQDERFAMAISNNSGAGGAALARRIFGEAITHSPEIWFCRRYRQYAHHEAALPVDQHQLIALIAPRPVYVASATEDLWADPRGEFLSALHASPVYHRFGLPGLDVTEMPGANRPVGQTIGYHLRTGKHDITAYDWQEYLRFADSHLKDRALPR